MSSWKKKREIDFRNKVWITRAGKPIKLHALTDDHLLAIVKMINDHQLFVGHDEAYDVIKEYNFRMKRKEEPNTILKKML